MSNDVLEHLHESPKNSKNMIDFVDLVKNFNTVPNAVNIKKRINVLEEPIFSFDSIIGIKEICGEVTLENM